MDFSLDKVRKVLKIAKEPISLDTPIGEKRTVPGGFIEDKKVVAPPRRGPAQSLGADRKVLATLTPARRRS